MQLNVLTRVVLAQSGVGLNVIQVRNHPKLYPWRYNRNNRESYLDPTRTPYTDKYNINEFNRHRKKKDWQKVIPKDKDNRFNRYQWSEVHTSDPKEAKATASDRLSRLKMSLEQRGSAREQVGYSPPENVQDQIMLIYRKTQLNSSESSASSPNLDDEILNIDLNKNRALKFNLITACIETFNHELPTPSLNDIQTIKDLVEYYSTPVIGMNPYESLIALNNSLPENLCLLPEPIRWDKENDEYFQGYNALPGVIGKVPGLRAAKKYPILNQDEFQWPDI